MIYQFDEDSVFCNYCDIPFNNHAQVVEHIKDNHPWAPEAKAEYVGREGIIACNLCSDGNMNAKQFENNNGLIYHQKMVHRGSKSKFIMCYKPKCRRKFSNTSEFEDHKPRCGKNLKA
ncbi:unnamed protein product [Prunus armeniaca]|uniref:C2H2-type domain-containing protein n=1 Tax=Prunus armeniaca TaxID=36596 RepID=A0A6J5Y795_PRUAR|nr:unnamed protein product [Prunus armeniaca]CAB4320412.1 unnamed protein product [Prunus armeniaca]